MILSYALFILNDDLERQEDDLKDNRYKGDPKEIRQMVSRKEQLKKAIQILEGEKP